MIDYAKLTKDLIAAQNAGREAAKGEDGGSANLDCAFLRVPRSRENKMEEAFEAAGVAGYKTKWFKMSGYMITPPGHQGNTRARAAEAMVKSLRESGYDALTYCQMD
jgi:hypothetical protein